MRFHVYFRRRKGSGTDPLLGSDTEPTFAAPVPPTAGKDIVLATKVGGIGNSIHRVVVGYRYEGVGSPTVLTAKLWAYDRRIGQWFLASSGSLTDGQLTYFRAPCLADPPQTNDNLGHPSSGGGEFMLTVADNASPDGVHHFLMSPDNATF